MKQREREDAWTPTHWRFRFLPFRLINAPCNEIHPVNQSETWPLLLNNYNRQIKTKQKSYIFDFVHRLTTRSENVNGVSVLVSVNCHSYCLLNCVISLLMIFEANNKTVINLLSVMLKTVVGIT